MSESVKYLCTRAYKNRFNGSTLIHLGEIFDVEKVEDFYFREKCYSGRGHYFSNYEISHHFMRLDIVIDQKIRKLLENGNNI
jgi:hypothetical protein